MFLVGLEWSNYEHLWKTDDSSGVTWGNRHLLQERLARSCLSSAYSQLFRCGSLHAIVDEKKAERLTLVKSIHLTSTVEVFCIRARMRTKDFAILCFFEYVVPVVVGKVSINASWMFSLNSGYYFDLWLSRWGPVWGWGVGLSLLSMQVVVQGQAVKSSGKQFLFLKSRLMPLGLQQVDLKLYSYFCTLNLLYQGDGQWSCMLRQTKIQRSNVFIKTLEVWCQHYCLHCLRQLWGKDHWFVFYILFSCQPGL